MHREVLWGFMLIKIFVYIFGGIGCFGLYYFINENRKKAKRRNQVKDRLNLVYIAKNIAITAPIDRIIKKYKTLIQTFPILKIEEDLIKEMFSETAQTADPNDECGICMCPYLDGDLKTIIHCTHAFHYGCLTGWCRIKPSCPFCKHHFRETLLTSYCERVRLENGENQA